MIHKRSRHLIFFSLAFVDAEDGALREEEGEEVIDVGRRAASKRRRKEGTKEWFIGAICINKPARSIVETNRNF